MIGLARNSCPFSTKSVSIVLATVSFEGQAEVTTEAGVVAATWRHISTILQRTVFKSSMHIALIAFVQVLRSPAVSLNVQSNSGKLGGAATSKNHTTDTIPFPWMCLPTP